MNEKLISVIIPVYKHEKELALALDSIKKQTYKNIEIVIERDEKHEGAPVMRNRGLAKANGEYVIFWDADVVAVPRMLEEMKKTLDENPQASFVYSKYKIHVTKYNTKVIPSRDFNVEILKQNNFIHSTSLIRRQDAIKWDESLKRFQDWDLWLTMAKPFDTAQGKQGKIGVYIPKTLFTIIAKGTMSSWLPKFAYKKPWKYLPWFKSKVEKYEKAREVVISKHSL
ncbi:MAG: glycosyltransferase family A protein [Candidatus Magasanikiibacteriota bacterium]